MHLVGIYFDMQIPDNQVFILFLLVDCQLSQLEISHTCNVNIKYYKIFFKHGA